MQSVILYYDLNGWSIWLSPIFAREPYLDAHDIEDPHARQVAATCLDRAMSDLIHDNWQDDDNGTINSYIKRWRREGYHMPTFLGLNGIDPDNNRVERTNRMFVCMIP